MGPGSSDPKNSSSCRDDQSPIPFCPPDDFRVPPPPPYPLPAAPHAASDGRSTFATALIIAITVLSFLFLCLSIFIFVRQRRRRRQALLEAAPGPAAATATFPDDGDGDGGDPGGEVVHHAWHIRTVGLDDAAIESIALTRYRAGGGGASDCTVCLGEFQDGELLRLLPKCAHAFHTQCIDTWLRAHVNCPLCRADVTTVDPATAAVGADADADAEQPPAADAADAAASASAEQSASNTRTMEQERANEQQELRVQIDQLHSHSHSHSSSLGERRPHRQVRNPGARAQSFRRVASMDSPSPSPPPPPAASAEEAREDEQLQAGGEKQGTGGAVCCEVSPEPGQLKRSSSGSSRWTLLSRHCRTRSSLLPL